MANIAKDSERFKYIFSNSGVGIFIVDKKRKIIEANETFCKIFGYEYKEIVGKSALDLHVSKEAYNYFAEIAFNKVRQNQPLDVIYGFKHRNGNLLWLRIAGDSISEHEEVLWIITDITSRVVAEQKLKETEELLLNAEEIAHLGSWEFDLGTKKFTCSKETFCIFGQDSKSFQPTISMFEMFLSKKDVEKLIQVDDEKEKKILEFKIKNSDKLIQVRRKIIYNKQNKPMKIMGTFFDITQQRANEKKIKKLNTQLNQEVKRQLGIIREQDQRLQYQSKLVQMGEMLNMIAHQWRQPLAAISATTSFLATKLFLGQLEKDIFLEEVRRIEDYTKHLSKTIEDFRSFFKSVKQQERTSLEEIIEITLNILRPILLNQLVKIETSYRCNVDIFTYKHELCQVILNIIKNSQDAFKERKIEKPFLSIETFCDNQFCYIVTKDNAEGIDEEIIDNIFDIYFSTKKHKNGTGVGLYMSKTIVEEHCGGILMAHNDNDGVVFTIKLPLK